MAYPIKRNTPWYKYAARLRSDHVRRTRECPRCGLQRETIEFAALMPKPESTPDRCPKCFIGPGKVKRTIRRGGYNFSHKIQESIGCVIRRRKCTECKHKWSTYETLLKAALHPDITRCQCGARMKVRRKR